MKINKNSDLEQLREIIKPILGQVCWEVRLGYGGELCLEIGKKIAYNSSLLKHECKGEWQFGSRGTNWQLIHNNQIVATSDLEIEEILPHLKVIEGTNIKVFETHYPDLVLTINFSKGDQLKIIPDLTDTEYQDVAVWELFTPNNQVLEVYPNFTWSAHPSNVPMGEMVATYRPF